MIEAVLCHRRSRFHAVLRTLFIKLLRGTAKVEANRSVVDILFCKPHRYYF